MGSSLASVLPSTPVSSRQLLIERTADSWLVDGADIVTAYVDLSAGTVTTGPQRYTRLGRVAKG